jgi:hypothetical protein
MRRVRPCHVLYHYQIHGELGWMHARIQTWFPFNIQVGLNGREWLSGKWTRRGSSTGSRETAVCRSRSMSQPKS